MPLEANKDRRSYEDVFKALNGTRFELDGGSSKVLRFMLEKPDGCDSDITPDGFDVRFGWHQARHRYFMRAAPPIVSQLIQFAGAKAPTASVRAAIGPATIPSTGFSAWSFGRRLLWIEATDGKVAINVRDDVLGASLERGFDPLPVPLDRAPRYLEFSAPFPCPHCGLGSHRYRHLFDGPLVCEACGRSFAVGDEA
jgi:hypothetical protein